MSAAPDWTDHCINPEDIFPKDVNPDRMNLAEFTRAIGDYGFIFPITVNGSLFSAPSEIDVKLGFALDPDCHAFSNFTFKMTDETTAVVLFFRSEHDALMFKMKIFP